jgi:hypothetical protein
MPSKKPTKKLKKAKALRQTKTLTISPRDAATGVS